MIEMWRTLENGKQYGKNCGALLTMAKNGKNVAHS